MNSTCPNCEQNLVLAEMPENTAFRYCPFCGRPKETFSPEDFAKEATVKAAETLLKPTNEVQFTIGCYQVLERLGKGGMGEVFFAYDTSCGRHVALKRIRTDLQSHRKLYVRFLKEARLTSQLTHPAIIPIYGIHVDDNGVYYTMPFIEGATLKEMIRQSRKAQGEEKRLETLGASIPSFTRAFLTICQAVAYSHSRGVLHRDLKPENVIVGQYGQITILDWGLAKVFEDEDAEDGDDIPATDPTATRPGKVVGTISYMAPERAQGAPASIQTEIYSLGVVLYQLLTLHLPFRRKSLAHFRKTWNKEVFVEPSKRAPLRDVPPMLSKVAQRCLEKDVNKRYRSVDELVDDIENYLGGRSEWFPVATLDPRNKKHWDFQEHVLAAEHSAITRHSEVTDWMHLMLSSASFVGNTQLRTRLKLHPRSHGLGFLLGAPSEPDAALRQEGYCLWIANQSNPSIKLYLNGMEILEQDHIALTPGQTYELCIEKVDNGLNFFLDGKQVFSYVSHLPLAGNRVGLLCRDANYDLNPLEIAVGNFHLKVSCLSVPDAFLAQGHYDYALEEYRRIAQSFPGRAEGREARFRAGVTLLEDAKHKNAERAAYLYDLSLEEFELLRKTPAAPWEYLGKSLVYQAQGKTQDEINSLELGYRRYRALPTVEALVSRITHRMHECARSERVAAYRYALLVNQLLPRLRADRSRQQMFDRMQRHWEPLPYFISPSSLDAPDMAVRLAFWLDRPASIEEIASEPQENHVLGNAWAALYLLGEEKRIPSSQRPRELLDTQLSEEETLRQHLLLMEHARGSQWAEGVFELYHTLSPQHKSTMHAKAYYIWASMHADAWDQVDKELRSMPRKTLEDEHSPLFFLQGVWLWKTQGKEACMLHYAQALDAPFPQTTALAAHWFRGSVGKATVWEQQSFAWERRQLHQQLSLIEHCLGEKP